MKKNTDNNMAFPRGTTWTPVETALSDLKKSLTMNLKCQKTEVSNSLGFILSEDVFAKRSNPHMANTAVDGFGFAFKSLIGPKNFLNLIAEQITPGSDIICDVPKGSAVRILTGASLPSGVDTVVLQEEVTVLENKISFDCNIKRGENTRKAGEDVKAGEVILKKGLRIRPQDIGLLVAAGLKEIGVYLPLRVGILSTGNEIVEKFNDQDFNKTLDANRPMLMSIMKKWGYKPIDLGHVVDDKHRIRDKLNQASQVCDVIFTSGGASTGKEDHVSRLLKSDGHLYHWKVAMKPGRPLALASWKKTPVIGLPGNPVAAFVCTLVFGKPICGLLSGERWVQLGSFNIPASFSKVKKTGRREYLRAKIKDGKAQIFHSEGSGRISGLSWAEGLIELPEDLEKVKVGDLVKYMPFSGLV